MGLAFNANGWLELAWGTAPGLSLTIFAYAKTSSNATRLAVSSGAPNSGDAVLVEVGVLSSIGAAFAQHRTPGSSRSASGAASMATDAWTPIMAHGQAAAPGTTLVHGASSTVLTDATARTAQTHTRLRVGASANLETPAASAMWIGDIAEVAVWKGLTNTEAAAVHAAIVAGALPETQQSEKLVDVWDLATLPGNGNYPGRVHGLVLATQGGGITQAATHPISRTTAGPSITTQPSNATVTTPATATFSVAASATGGGALSYQWQRSTNNGGSWSNVSTGTGGTTASYTTAATSVTGGNANNADQYRCAVTETGGTNAGTVNSGAAILTVNAAATGPTINTQPASAAVTAPATATFTVAATTSGGALSYQWQRNSANISGANSASYTTPATTVTGGSANSGDLYRCVVTDSNGSTTSSAATLTVNPAPGVLAFQAAGMEFGRRTGLAISTFALDAGSNYRYTVHADALVLGAAVYTSGVVATDSAGKLPNLSNSALTTGATYRVVAVRQADGEAATFRMVAA